jgi:very-short-patch-repair endonuclease
MENQCKICNKSTANKVYCSVECQHTGYKKPINERIRVICLYCKTEFEDLKRTGKNPKQKIYCSRICKDSHQKEKYIGDGNPAFGRVASEKERKKRSKMAKKMWKEDGHKEKVQAGKEKFKYENGYWPGTDEASKNKRRETCLEKYGIDHNWKNKEIYKKCEDTIIKLYGKMPIEIATSKLFETSETSIEKIIKELLIDNKIKFKKNFHIYFNDKDCKIYDFFLPEYNILIEADGDYWHGNPQYFSILNEIQVINKKNDLFKDELAKQEGYLLLRFWENQIKNANFEDIFLEAIKHGKKG